MAAYEEDPERGQHLSLAQIEERAKLRLHPLLYEYYAYTIGDVTRQRARHALDSLLLRTRILVGPSVASTECTVLGRRLLSPILVAPVAFHGFMHSEAELGTAKGAAEAGCGFIVNGPLSNTPLQQIFEAGQRFKHSDLPAAVLWLHVYIFKERHITANLLRKAEELGYTAIVLTCDHPTTRITDIFIPRHLRHSHEMPQVQLPNLDPDWRLGMPLIGSNDDALSWEDVAWVKSLTRLPVVVKGVLCPEDALLAALHGADAVVVSNHGFRQVDGTPAAIEVLQRIVAALASFRPNVEILYDSGIRSGGDVLRAIALGARAVLVGRPAMWGLAYSGANGVRRVLELLTNELRADMAHCGCRTLSQLPGTALYERNEFTTL